MSEEESEQIIKRELKNIPGKSRERFLAAVESVRTDKKKIHILARAFRYDLTDYEIGRLLKRRTAEEMLQLLYGISWNKQTVRSISVNTEEEQKKNALLSRANYIHAL